MTWPPIALLVLWCLWVAQAAWSCFNAWSYRARAKRFEKVFNLRLRNRGLYTPTAVVIVPVKGAGEHFARHVKALATQDYPHYRIVFAIESAEDPAYAALESMVGSIAREIQIVIAGPAERGGQKVHNQLCALRHLRETDEAIVFADADAVPHDQWLGLLTESLRRNNVGATTGYRWLVPSEGQSMFDPACFASVINASIATLLGRPRRNHAWGGSMAISQSMLHQSRLLEHWDGALSDDYQMTRAIRSTGRKIVFVPRCVVVSPAHFTWPSLIEFGRRQYIITRVHAPLIWLVALLAPALYTIGWISVLAAVALRWPGAGWGLGAWAVVVLMDLLRARLRRRAVDYVLGPQVSRDLAAAWRLERWGTPFWMALHLCLVLQSALSRRITWAGITYDLCGRRDVRIVARPRPQPSTSAHGAA